MNIRNIFAIFKKEVRGYIYNPTTYIIAGVFIAVWEFLFFQNVFLVGEASLQGLFGILPWFFLLFIPAITMGSIAEETNKETLEILLTHPIRDRELVLGKYLSALAFSAVVLLASLPIALSLKNFGDLDMGVYIGQYVAALLFSSALIGLGVGVSSYFKNQVAALMVSVVSTFVLIMIGSEIVTMSIPSWLGTLFARFSVLPHYNAIARGVLDVRDIWYFILFTVICLELGHLKLITRRTSRRSKKVLSERSFIIILVGVFVGTVGFGFFPSLRVDLTAGNIYTLTSATKDILAGLEDDVEIILYESPNLPAQFQPLSRTVKDVLKDYSGSHVKILYKNPDADPTVAQEAQENGIRPAQFNMTGNGEFQIKQAYFGLMVKAAGKNKTIPLIQTTSDFEYQLTSFISELTKVEKKKIGFLDIAGKTSSKGYTVLAGELKKQFAIEDIALTEASSTIPERIDTLVVARPTGTLDELYETALRDFLSQGKNVLFLMDGVEVNAQYMMALSNGTTTDYLLKEYGVTVNQDLVYDLRSNQTVRVGGGQLQYFLPYPAFVRAGVTEGALAGSKLTSVVVPWGSTVSVDDSVLGLKNMQSIPLVYTSESGGVQTQDYMIDPQGVFPRNDLGQKILAVILKPAEEGGEGVPSIIVVGDSDFLSDDYAQGVPENIAFGMEIISYLSQEGSLAGIKLKQEASSPLLFENPEQRTWVQYGNMGGILVVLITVAVVLIGGRRKMRTVTYKEGKNL
jgi:ABC-2 type transport system permease protein